MNLNFNITIGILFIAAGALLGSQPLIDCLQGSTMCPIANTGEVYGPNTPLIEEQPSDPTENSVSGFPARITIPNRDLAVDIEAGRYDASRQVWTIGDNKAYFATVTSEPNTVSGNTFIYGHNRAGIFQALPGVEIGDEAFVTTENGRTFVYQFISMRETSPEDVSLFEYQGEPILTLQTCTGLWSQHRSLFTFKLIEVR